MRPRMFHALAGEPDAIVIRAVAEGLTLIAGYVSELQSSIEALTEPKQPAGIAAVSAIADEEAAKYLILVDAMRSQGPKGPLVAAKAGPRPSRQGHLCRANRDVARGSR